MNDIRNLEPKALWENFYSLTRIPRPSKKEAGAVAFVEKFGKSLGLDTVTDEIGNVIIRKPATKGYEDRKTVILQSHLDMVPQKNNDKKHDFEKDPIEAYIDGEWVTADGTTLGADNGIGDACSLAILASKDIEHGPLEALFTIDEETGMTGANGLKANVLKGDILINLDSESEGELCIGCAGGVNVNITKKYVQEDTPKGMTAYKLELKGMKGGHSGMDISLGRANANKLSFRFFNAAGNACGMRIASYEGGNMRNAIPREAIAVVVVPSDKANDFEALVAEYEKTYQSEFAETEPDFCFTVEKTAVPDKIMDEADQKAIVKAVFVSPNGIMRMSQSMKGLVETSNNLAIVKIDDGIFEVMNLTRGFVDSSKDSTADRIAATFELIGADAEFSGEYPGWKPDVNSPILHVMSGLYKELFGKEVIVNSVHAGLECGIIGGTYPNLDMVSLGPTILHPHSPDEKVNIASVQKFFTFVCETLKRVPKK